MTRASAKWVLAAWLPFGAGLAAACHGKQELPATEELCIGPFGICARLVDGRVACWNESIPFVVDAHARRLQCAKGAVRMCVEDTAGRFQCWVPSPDFVEIVPLAIPPEDILPLEHWWMDPYDDVQGCGIQADGSATCWPTGDTEVWKHYKLIDYPVQSLSFTYPCLVLVDTDGALHAHYETDGCGALKPTDPYDEPRLTKNIEDVPSGTNWRFVAGGRYHACALDDQGQATCWGGHSPQALEAPSDVQFTELSATNGATCGITTDGHIRCWAGAAWNDSWDDTGSNSWIPDDVPTSGGWAHVVMGDSDEYFACAIDTAGQVSCFGNYWVYTSLSTALDNPVDEPPPMPSYNY